MEPVEANELVILYAELSAREKALAQLLEAKEFMLAYEATRLQADYMNKIGDEENMIIQLESKLKRANRKIEIIRDLIDKKETIDMEIIDAQIEWEFIINEENSTNDENLFSFTVDRDDPLKLSEEKSRRLKKMYYNFAKKLHPDNNPDLSENELILWHKVQTAYENNSFEDLELLYELYAKSIEFSNKLPQKEEIKKRIDKIRDLTHQTFSRIADIEQSFPFTVEEQLNNDEWINEKTEVNKQIKEQLAEDYSFTQYLLKVMLQSVGIAYKGEMELK